MRAIVRKTLREQYPHLRFPAAVYARIASRKDLADSYEYVLAVTDADGNRDESVPLIPAVSSTQRHDPETLVIAALPYGELSPFILGEVQL